ncbi:amidohydrolase family protein [Pseudoclavibacter sp. CFCC 13611]|uniref:amidohydrolase family protein n=1 Tax=Pseudoclavibacter sp. CFCC 13611 TaxID=2615178 RepID=UPI0013016546|nr:amidohydrolase family protein [Pseudoclavibacter sp. CFCC 13611]KAB1664193.1 amidohydrolase family protein [Pseudoclavibacter sp. CFCC 13611]
MRTIIHGATVITRVDDRVIERGDVSIEHGIITAVNDTAQMHRESGDDVVDAHGLVLLPGLINMHDHIARKRLRLNEPGVRYKDQSDRLMREPNEYLALHTARNLADHLHSGVTTVRDFGLPGATALAARKAVEQEVIAGPRIFTGGDPIAITGGHATNWGAQAADGTEDVVRAVRRSILTDKVDVVKFMASGGLGTYPEEDPGVPELTYEELAAGISTAHQFHRPTAAHAYSTQAILNAVQAGIDTVEHGAFMNEEAQQLMVERGTAHVPTISGLIAIGYQLQLIGQEVLGRQILDDVIARLLESVRMSADHGIPLATGTDTSGEIVEELELIAQATGWAPERALGAATDVAADILGQPIGRIRSGHRADLLLVDGDPTQDLEALRRPVSVFARGRVFAGRPAPLGVRVKMLRGIEGAAR